MPWIAARLHCVPVKTQVCRGADCASTPQISCVSAIQEKKHRDRLCAFIPPGVPRPILHNHVATLQMQRLAVVQLQPNLSVVNNRVVDSVRLVHPGIFFFEVIG
jgi:hypothetical protein